MSTSAAVFAPGFFASAPVHSALSLGCMVAAVCGMSGVFAIARGQAFAGEALSDVGAAGGSASFLVGAAPLWGFLVASLGAATAIELGGLRRQHDRDSATAIVLGGSLGLAALFLYLDSTTQGASDATVAILFGSPFALTPSLLPGVASLSVLATAMLVLIGRSLLLSTVSADLAAVRGVRVRLIGLGFLLTLAVVLALAALTIGAILGTALIVGPAAAAGRLARKPLAVMLLAAALGLSALATGVLLAYDSYEWPPQHHGWPVSFFVVMIVLLQYVASNRWLRRGASRRRDTSA